MTGIVFLGTSSGVPTKQRNQSSACVRFDDGAVWMIDCGEATQHRLQHAALRPSAIEAILITHLHGDHCFGLPGMLSALDIANRRGRPLTLVGPAGIRAMWGPVLRGAGIHFGYDLIWRELEDDCDFGLGPRRVQARRVRHRVPCFAFVITDAERTGSLDVAALRARGVEPGPCCARLKAGEDLRLPNGAVVHPADVLAPPTPGHRIVFSGDTDDASPVAEAAVGCDVLVHEATYLEALRCKTRTWRHSTASMAAEFAVRIAARHLILTHFSSRYTVLGGPADIPALAAEARAAASDLPVHCADDLDVFELGYKGGRRLVRAPETPSA